MCTRSVISFGFVLLLAACSSTPKSEQATVMPADGVTPIAAKPQSFPKPIVSPTALIPVPAIPGLIKPTNARMRVPTIVTGRDDPFAAVATAPIRLTVAASQPAVTLPSPLPASTQATLPAFKPSSIATVPSTTPLPTTPLPQLLPSALVSRTAIAEAIEVSGVIKVGGKWSIIVKEPDAQTSHYVHAGSYLANGQVLVKRIVAGGGSNPIVVLQQNGVEIPRTIGGGTRLARK